MGERECIFVFSFNMELLWFADIGLGEVFHHQGLWCRIFILWWNSSVSLKVAEGADSKTLQQESIGTKLGR